WRRLVTRRDDTYRALVNDGTGIDAGVLIRIVPCPRNRKRAIVIVLHAHNTILLSIELVRLNHPDSLRLWRFAVSGCYRDGLAIHSLNGATLRCAGRQVQDKAVAGSGICFTVKGNNPAINGADTPAHNFTGEHLVSHGNDVPGLGDVPVQADIERNDAILIVGEDAPAAFPVCL